LVASVPPASLADEQRTRDLAGSGNSRPLWSAAESLDMFWNFTGTVGRQEMRRTILRNEPELVKSQKLADVSAAFDAWLQAYRNHLEEICQRASSRSERPANG
jgi:hypothetical protein